MSTTSLGEHARQVDSAISSLPGPHQGLRQVFGTIREVHHQKPLIRAYDDSGSPLANDKWIPLNHSTQEIAERFGTIRQGMRIAVWFSGPDGAGANATIVGVESERNTNQPYTPNTIERGLFRIFSPGR